MTYVNKGAFDDLLDEKLDTDVCRQILIDLAARGETAEDITTLVQALRGRMLKITPIPYSIDCCGTGGDGSHSLNVSTAVSFVIAGLGVPVAKHGNRAASSKSGAADVLEAMGINVMADRALNDRAFHEMGFCFLMAPLYHPALRHIAPIRKSIASRTIFNLTGPLLNPALVDHQLIGVFDQKWLRPFAEALKAMGKTKSALIVCSDDGLDEISLSAPTRCAHLKLDGAVDEFTVTPDDFGLNYIEPESIAGGDAAYNAAALLNLLKGAESPYRQVVLANAAACLFVLGRVKSFKDGVDMAARSIDDGMAFSKFESYRQFINDHSGSNL